VIQSLQFAQDVPTGFQDTSPPVSAGKVASLAVVNRWDISSSRTLPTNDAKAALERAAESSTSWARS